MNNTLQYEWEYVCNLRDKGFHCMMNSSWSDGYAMVRNSTKIWEEVLSENGLTIELRDTEACVLSNGEVYKNKDIQFTNRKYW